MYLRGVPLPEDTADLGPFIRGLIWAGRAVVTMIAVGLASEAYDTFFAERNSDA